MLSCLRASPSTDLAVWEWLVSVLVLPILALGFTVVMLLCFSDMDSFKIVMIKNCHD
ncbi:hypothetical protein [Streptococcus pasteurianus]